MRIEITPGLYDFLEQEGCLNEFLTNVVNNSPKLNIRKVTTISNGFTWAYSPQDHAFWSILHDKAYPNYSVWHQNNVYKIINKQ